jgi:flavin-dependent dehydrogenase
VSERLRDAVVVGAGPAGLSFAIGAAERGLDVTVLERRGEGPLAKACGEGLLPAGVRALSALGVLPLVAPSERAPIAEIRWVEAGGASARLRLPAPGGIGIRRLALSAALLERARRAGVEVVADADVTLHRRDGGAIPAGTADRSFPGRVLVAADGLGSPTRRREGLDAPAPSRPRFGIRRHYAVRPWSDAVEVHFGEDAEAYVTPAGTGRVGVAILFERTEAVSFDRLLARFPAVERLVAGAAHDSAVRGAGPFHRRARARVADRLVLLGDAAGYVDAVTGDGLSLAMGCAADLAALLPDALARGATRGALRPYEAAWRRRYLPYAAWTRAMLALTRHPAVRRRVLALAASRPAPFERAVAAAIG